MLISDYIQFAFRILEGETSDLNSTVDHCIISRKACMHAYASAAGMENDRIATSSLEILHFCVGLRVVYVSLGLIVDLAVNM